MQLPNFLICGTQKGGTTALYFFLKEHPEIFMPENKEIHFFDQNYHKGITCYATYFNKQNEKVIRFGEATPIYMYLENIPQRIRDILPHAKLIFILRNPVDRAYSHYWHERKLCVETLSFEKAIEKEDARLLLSPFHRQHFSYKDRGKYIVQLKRFTKLFPKKQILILLNQDMLEHPNVVMKQIFRFLDIDDVFKNNNLEVKHYTGKRPRFDCIQRLKPFLPGSYLKRFLDNVNLINGYPPMNNLIRKKLLSDFIPYTAELEDFLRKKLNWQQ